MKKIKGTKLHPALLFLVLTIVIMVVSCIGNLFNLETSYYTVNTVSGELVSETVTISNLFNRTGLQYLISHLFDNFMSFAPLGNLIIGLLGVGVAYKSGFLNTFFKMISHNTSRKLITFVIVFLGVIFSMFWEVGYVILVPLAAILFLNLGRHPSAGVCAAFAGITFGRGANIVVNGLDGLLIKYTNTASTIFDATYKAHLSGNLFFMVVSTLLIAYVGMIVTERFIILKLGKYNFSEEENFIILQQPNVKEKKGVIIALLAVLLVSLIIIYCIIYGLPFSGLLLYLKDSLYVDQLFGENSYFMQGSVCIFSFLLMLAGFVYGIRVKTIKSNWDFVDGMNYYLKDVSSLLVLIFFASQFCLIFEQTNMGIFLVAFLAQFMSGLELSGFVLVVISFLVVLISSFFVPDSGSKWAILAPVVVPMFMQSSMTPEFAQAVFRAADSAIKGLTPLFSYFVILIGFLQIYNSKKNKLVTITEAMKLMVPYSIAFTVLWLIIVLAFFVMGIPLGVDTSVMI